MGRGRFAGVVPAGPVFEVRELSAAPGVGRYRTPPFFVRAAVEAENHRRLFAGVDDAIAAVVDPAAAAAWHGANAAVIERRDDVTEG